MTTTYVETDVEGVVDVVDVEDAVDGGLDVGDLVYYKWAVGQLGRSREHSETLILKYCKTIIYFKILPYIKQ